jgi:hypothetical protein
LSSAFPRIVLWLRIEKVEFFTWLEADGFAGSDADFGACTGIAADPGFARANIENAEAAQLDALALGEGTLEALEYSIHGSLRLVALKAGTLDHMVNDVLFYQGFLRSGEQSASRLIVETFSRVVNAVRVPGRSQHPRPHPIECPVHFAEVSRDSGEICMGESKYKL